MIHLESRGGVGGYHLQTLHIEHTDDYLGKVLVPAVMQRSDLTVSVAGNPTRPDRRIVGHIREPWKSYSQILCTACVVP